MISKKDSTVLVLGAGASAPFGFPSGRGLIFNIYKSLSRQSDDFFRLLLNCGYNGDLITAFRHELYHSMQPSVDAFLEKRPEFLGVGKAAIACALIPYEKQNILNRQENKQSWYEYLFNKMNSDLNDFHLNKISVITFNYDRSFEYFFINAIKYSYGLDYEKSVSILKSIPIIHVYGKLGSLPNLGDKTRPYNDKIDPDIIKLCSSEIKILYENTETDPEIIKSQSLIKDQKNTCILGFGYHPTNVNRLFRKLIDDKILHSRKIFGSAFGIEDGEIPKIRQLFHPKRIELGSKNEDVLDFLRKHELFIN